MPAENMLFAYGSLMFPEVWMHVVGRERPSIPASLAHHTAFKVDGFSFPGLVPTTASPPTPGRLYSDLSDDDWRRLDAFEDTFYHRSPVEVSEPGGQNHTAAAYIVMPDRVDVLSDEIWQASWFEQHALGDFLDRICGFEPS